MVTTRFMAKGGSSFKKKLISLKAGDSIQASTPRGNFILNDTGQRHVLVAGGIGITPFRSIILDLDYRNILKNIVLFYSNRTSSIVFKHQLDAVDAKRSQFKLIYVIKPEICDVDFIKKNIHDVKDAVYMISGPIGMVRDISRDLVSEGVDKKNIVTDYFPGYD